MNALIVQCGLADHDFILNDCLLILRLIADSVLRDLDGGKLALEELIAVTWDFGTISG